MEANLEQLKDDYINGRIVPFIGAGLSVPFKVPTWKMLIENITEKYAVGKRIFIKGAVEMHLESNDYWGAIGALKQYAFLTDQDIQTEIVKLIKEKQISLENNNSHNYSDLGNMDFKLYLTTNYENLLHEYVKCDALPILLKQIDFSTQGIFDEKRIFHLHGFTSNPGSIVISKESYLELYNDNKYEKLLSVVTSSKKLLFMGFSFDDQFVSTLLKDHKKYFKGTHYIILNNPTDEKIRELRNEYGLITIEYQAEDSSHTEEIRKILNYIAEPKSVAEKKNEPITGDKESQQTVLVGAGISNMNQSLENNLFYKKLSLESIDSAMIKLSSLFYIAAEIYIRELRKSGMSLEIIDAILGKIFIKYNERYADTYEKYGDSRQFLEVVHNSLEEIDFGRYAESFKDSYKSDGNENRGLIHVLAEDEKKGVWWGEKRLDGQPK
jgi:hypothetical protein